jgi:hypothetical protein
MICPACMTKHDGWLGSLCPKCYWAVQPAMARKSASVVKAYTYMNALDGYSKLRPHEKDVVVKEVLCPKVKLLFV